MPDTDVVPTNGHTRAPLADSRDHGDVTPDHGKNVQTLVDERLLLEVAREQRRLGVPGPRSGFMNEVIRIGLKVSARRPPRRLEDELDAIIRPANGAK